MNIEVKMRLDIVVSLLYVLIIGLKIMGEMYLGWQSRLLTIIGVVFSNEY